MSSSSVRSPSIRGPIGPRPGVYRPCARCRVKKTKCDRLKPTCSSCVKAGSDVMCVYDNDEPSLDADNDVTSTEPISDIARTDSAARIDSELSSRKEASSKFKKLESSDSTATAISKGTNGHATRSSGAGDNGSIGSNGSNASHDNNLHRTQSSFGNKEDRMAVQLSKKTKTGSGSGSSQITKPSPLRRAGVSISEVTKEQEHTADENVDIMSVDDVEDKLISGLTVKESAMDDAPFETTKRSSTYQPENTSSHATATPVNSSVGGGGGGGGVVVSRPRKQLKTTSTAGVAQSRIMVDLPTTKPSPAFVIDKTQRARKWGRSSIMVQTLGGEISVPLWTSDQQMLLNEPRPYFVQRSFPHLTNPAASSSSSSSSTATNLARMAVLNQMDSKPGFDTPERGTTPDSGESSPVQPSSPLMATMKKKKRGFRKHVHDVAERSAGDISAAPIQKRKRVAGSSSLDAGDEILGGGAAEEDGPGELSSTRSTPAPTSRSSSALPTKNSTSHKPRAIPTRPRMYPCSFEGCTKSFMDKFHLKRHETRHVTQVIVCGVDGCTKAYDSLSTMRRHQSMMHKQWKEEMAAAGVDVGIRKAWQQKQDAERNKSSRLSEDEDGEEDDGPGEGEGAAEEDGPMESPGSSPGPSAPTYNDNLRYHD